MLHGDLATPADDRNVETAYAYNTTAYIVAKPQWQKLWAGTTSGSAGAEQAFSEYLYDDATVVGTLPLKGNLTGTRSYWQATPSYAYTTNSTSYDSYGRPLTVSDGRGSSTTTSYDPFYGYAASVTNALGHVTSTVVDPRWGVPTQTTDANGHVTTLQYDGYGRLTAVWLPTEPTSGPASYLFSYDAAARPARVQSRRLQDAGSGAYRESWQYVDGFGRTLQTQQPTATGGSRVVTSQQYDGQGQLLHQSAAYAVAGAAGSGYVAPDWTTVAGYHRFGYDELGNLWLDETKSQNSVLWSTTTMHDGWQRRQYDPNGRRTDYDADAFGNLGQVVEYNTGAVYTTTYSYTLAGALAQVTDAAGNVTSMGYDLLGRKTAMSDPDMGQWQYQYDAAGNLTAQRDGRGLWLHLGYDELNRLTSKRQDDPVSGSLIADYSYDAPGQLGLPSRSRAYSAAGVVEVQALAYDSRGQVTQQQWVVPGSGGGTFRLDTAYNAAGRKAALTYPGGSGGQQGEVVSFGYDAIGQLTSVGGVVGGTTTLYLSAATYNAQGQPLELVNDSGANGLRRQYGYESNTQRLSVLRAGKTSPYTDLQELTYSYDNAGNVTSIVDGRNGSQRQCFQYDWLDRLTGAFTGDAACSAYSAAGVGAYSHSYGYDAIGNLTDYAGSSYTYGTTNAQPHAVASAYGNSYGYDANGNQVRRTIAGVEYTLVYDYDNRLVTVQQGETLLASFLYDAQGNRVMGTVGGVSTVYIAGLYEQSGAASTSYYEGGAMRRAGYASSNGVFYLLQDQLKSTSVIADQMGAEAARQFFYPYGANRGGTAYSELTTKRFTGQYHEQGLPGAEGLSYYNARWYDPQLARFISPDTIVPGPANPQNLNRFAYANNSPVVYADPSGHGPQTQLCECFGRSIVVQVTQQWQTVKQNLIRWSDFFDGFLQLTTYTRNPSSYTSDRMVEEGLQSGNAQASKSRLTKAYLYAAYSPSHLSRPQLDAALLNSGTLERYTQQPEISSWQHMAATTMVAAVAGATLGSDGAGSSVSPYSPRKFRYNLGLQTGIDPASMVGFDAHHVFPQTFIKNFRDLGIDINDPRYGVWMEKNYHQSMSYEYNKAWGEFFRSGPTPERAFELATDLAPKYGYEFNISKP